MNVASVALVKENRRQVVNPTPKTKAVLRQKQDIAAIKRFVDAARPLQRLWHAYIASQDAHANLEEAEYAKNSLRLEMMVGPAGRKARENAFQRVRALRRAHDAASRDFYQLLRQYPAADTLHRDVFLLVPFRWWVAA